MKLYICDKGWKGAAVVVADSREHACELAKNDGWDYKPDDWEEHEVYDLTFTLGD